MAAVIAAVLALAGAPANTVVVCNPDLPVGGRTTLSTPPLIQLRATPCAAVLLAAASPAERAAIARLNPGVVIDRIVGAGLAIALHEAFHASLRSGDEALVQCNAMKRLPELLAKYAPDANAAWGWARAYDADLPPEYHGTC